MNQHTPIKIAGIGRYLPEKVIESGAVEKECNLTAGYCFNELGVERRRWITDETVSYMGAKASEEALEHACVKPAELDLILNASMSFDRIVPDGGPLIQRLLGVEESGIPCTTLKANCLGFLAALDVCCSLIATGRYRKILIVNSETMSLMVDKQASPDAYAMVGDGAAAAVITSAGESETSAVDYVKLANYAAGASYMESLFGWAAVLNNVENAAEMALRLNRKFFETNGKQYVQELVKDVCAEYQRDTISLVVPQQSSRSVLDYLETVFGSEKVVDIMRNTGYCGSASLPMALYEAVETRRLNRNDRFMMGGFGPGLSAGMMVAFF